jgi:hypothetical protein
MCVPLRHGTAKEPNASSFSKNWAHTTRKHGHEGACAPFVARGCTNLRGAPARHVASEIGANPRIYLEDAHATRVAHLRSARNALSERAGCASHAGHLEEAHFVVEIADARKVSEELLHCLKVCCGNVA